MTHYIWVSCLLVSVFSSVYLALLPAGAAADKNQHRIDEAHAVFQEIQNAYEVLSDKHERAWWVGKTWGNSSSAWLLMQCMGLQLTAT